MKRIDGAGGLWIELLDSGAVRRIGRADDMLTLWVGGEAEASQTQIFVRAGDQVLPLLGPSRRALPGLHTRVRLALADDAPAWFWHLDVANTGSAPLTLDAIHVQDLALTAYGAVRNNEYYVSHYIDLAPLAHAQHGTLVAARQNMGLDGRHPWALLGSMGRTVSYATDGRQLQSLASLLKGLPGSRLQHEHALAALQDAPLTLPPGASARFGWFGRFDADHAAASGEPDLALADATLALAATTSIDVADSADPVPQTLFTHAPFLAVHDLSPRQLDTFFGSERRHAEHDDAGALLAFFDDSGHHVVLGQKELRVLRPHGHILRTGRNLTPDETALTSTAWMNGVFHSMLCQGHVLINRFLSTVRGQLGQFRSHGQRIFVSVDGAWQQLGLPSAWRVEPAGCRWVYAHAGGIFTVDSRADASDGAMHLRLQVLHGAPLQLLLTHHVALAGDDGSSGGPAQWHEDGDTVVVRVPAGSELAQRFPDGSFAIEAVGSRFGSVRGDAALHADGASRDEPYICIEAEAAPTFALRIVGRLVTDDPLADAPPLPAPRFASGGAHAAMLERLSTTVPWFGHNALVHYLAPRGLEQYSGGGWGTRDVCQGPLEMLLACGRTEPVRAILATTYAAQNPDGDWPQWFMFFERERAIRASDSHGDIVFWPLLALARYIVASGDVAFLDTRLPFFDAPEASVWEHVERALGLIDRRRIAGTRLATYGHGDWNDALQPADPALRDHLCSAWTVTLHHQTLRVLAAAARIAGRDATHLEAESDAVADDFRRLLVADGVVAGYALFDDGAEPTELLLHPSDTRTGLHYSLLPMMHAVLAELLPPELAQAQLKLIDSHLTGPDGARLFDRPMAYHGGPERVFQRAESSAHFGREIALMYMHAHVRWAETLAHVGRGADFFAALQRLHPIGLPQVVPSAALRQSNCYHSSSDAAFADRYEAQDDYARINAGTVALEGGWRVYSSGPGIALALLQRHLVGVIVEHDVLVIDPVLPPDMSGLIVRTELLNHAVELAYSVGSAGFGPTAVTLNGTALPITRRANRYRTGAAAVARDAFESALRMGGNRLAVQLG